jgi:hypothetical protein
MFYQTGEGWPTYTKNGVGYGFVQDSSVYRYYGGQVFRANEDFKASGVKIEACYNVASTTIGDTSQGLEIYESDTYTPSQAIELSTWTYIGQWRDYLPFCEDADIQERTLSGAYFFEDRTYTFKKGKYYALVISSRGIHENIKYTRTSPNSNAVSVCGDGLDLFCGGFVLTHSTSTYGLWLSFDGLANAESIYGACIISEFPYFDIQKCITNAFAFLFVPDDDIVQSFSNISFASSSPFSYLYQVSGYLKTIRDATATNTPKIVINAPHNSFTIFSIASTSPMFGSGANTIKQFLTWIIWIVAMFVAVYEIYYFIRKTE